MESTTANTSFQKPLKWLPWPDDLAAPASAHGPLALQTRDPKWLRYAHSVLRLKAGYRFVMAHFEVQTAWQAELVNLDRNQAAFTLLSQKEPLLLESPQRVLPQVTLAIGQLKEQRWDWVLQKVTELGIHSIQPLETDYTQGSESRGKEDRWQEILKQAALQSEQLVLPVLMPPKPLSVWMDSLSPQTWVFPAMERGLQPSHSLLTACQQGFKQFREQWPQQIMVLVGPEGGWSPQEKEAFQARHQRAPEKEGFLWWHSIHLGSTVLRSETAAIVAIAQIKAILEM
jgi:16S rRNA (uracil1498-N3)-methyltransferase